MSRHFSLQSVILRMKQSLTKTLVCIGTIILTTSALANPVLDNVAAGNATVSQTNNSTVVNQTSQKAILNWQSFNIGQGEHTHFQQPAGGIALNRINGQAGPSSIYGQLSATGQIILVNPAGIFFGVGASVNVGGLIATTANITDQNFLNSNYQFTNDPNFSGSIINEGQIIAAKHGLVALVGPNVVNKGLIQAELGTVVLASGSAFTINFAGNNLINFTVDQKATGDNVGVTNAASGIVSANGGKILVTAKAAQGVLDRVINMEGVLEAKSVSQQNGVIILSGDADAGIVRVAAKVDASGKNTGEKGGKVEITGYNVLVDAGSEIDVSGDAGGGNVNIGGNYQGKGPLLNSNITVFHQDAKINADAINSGNGGNVILWADNATYAKGEITARGGAQSGDGGFIETSSKNYLDVNGIRIDTRAANGKRGTWLLDPSDLTISNAASSNVTPTNPFSADSNSTNSNLEVATLEAALATSDVIVETFSGGTGGGVGNITVVDPVTWLSAFTLNLNAFGGIFINAAITATNGGLALTSNNASQINSAVNIGTNLTFNNAANFSLNNVISGTGGIIKNGTGALLLFGANTNTGATTINAGTVQLQVANALNATSGLTVDTSGALDLNNNNLTVGSLSGAGNIALGNATLTNNTSATTTYSGVLSGTGNFVLSGTGDLTLSGSNTYDGTTTINGGVIRATNSASLGSTVGGTTVNSGGTLQLTNVTIGAETLALNGTGSGSVGALRGVGTSTYGGTITLGSATTIGVSAGSLSLTGSMSGAFDLTKIGPGTLTLGNNTNIGNILLNQGILQLGASNIISDTTTITLANTTGVAFDLNGFSDTIANISGGGTNGGDITLGAGTLTLGNASNTTYSGVISGTSGNIVKQGAGILTLSNNNTYTGTTTINGGTIQLGIANALSSSTILNGTGILDLNGFSQTLAGLTGSNTINNAGAASTLTIDNSALQTFSGTINGNTSFVKNGAGTLAFALNNTYTGTTTINDGILQSQATDVIPDTSALTINSSGTFDLNGNSETIASLSGAGNISLGSGFLTTGDGTNTTFTGVISDGGAGGGLIKEGSGTFTLSGANAYSGSTTINGGIIRLGAANALPSTSLVGLANTAGVALDLNNFNLTIAGLALGGATGGNVTLGSGTLTFGNGLGFTYGGVISGSGSIIKQGSGNYIFSNAQTYTGGTTINGGSLQFNGATATASLAINSGIFRLGGNNVIGDTVALTLADVLGVELDLNGFSDTINVINGGGTTGGNINLGAGTLTTGDSSNQTFAGVISGTGNLIKQGSGTLTLSNANTYSGTTTINAGTVEATNATSLGTTAGGTIVNGATLLVNGVSIGNESLTLNNATLSGSGTSSYGGNVTLNNGTANTIQANSGSNFTINGTIDGASDLTLQGSGNLALLNTVGAGTNLSSITSNVALTLNGSYLTTGNQIYNSPVTLAGSSAFTVFGDGAPGSFNLTFNGVSGNQNLTLSGGTVGDFTYTLDGTLALNNVSIEGNAANNHIFVLPTSSGTRTWNITGANTGNITGVSGVAGTFSFTDIQNLTGGSGNDSFVLAGGSIATIDGGAGTNTLTGANVANTWNITGSDTGNVTGMTGNFSNIQNLTGGNADNNFIFADGTNVSGTINGGSLANNNTLDYSAYTSPTKVVLSSTNDGLVRNNSGTVITNFTNINNLTANTLMNEITLPNKTNVLTVTDARIGFINDPINFNGYQVFRSISGTDQLIFNIATSFDAATSTAVVNGVTMYFINFTFSSTDTNIPINIAQIIEQSIQPPSALNPNDGILNQGVENNIQDIIQDQIDYENELLNKLKVVLNCYQAQT